MSKENMNQLDLPFKDKLYRFALKYVSNSFDAEDIIQDLMIKIWKRMDQYTDIENKEAWCMTVTRNLAIDRIRRRKKDAIKDISDYHHLSNNDVLQDKKMESEEKVKSIMKLVDQLPEKQRIIIHLRDVEGYSYQEVADMTNSKLDFVKVSLHRARKTLKEQLLKRNFQRV